MNATSPELEGCPIVYFGNDWFAENRTSAHHIARRLAQRFPVLYIETPGLRAPNASGRDLRKLARKLKQAVARPRRIGGNMWHMTVPQVPFRGLPLVSRFNELFSAWQLRRALRGLGWGRPIVWFTVPHAAAALRHSDARLSVYYCVDDYSALPGVNADSIRRMDTELSSRADVIFAVSRVLVEAKLPLNRHVFHAPHGVDVDLFRQASDPALVPAEAVRGLRHPVVGYFGVLDGRIDVAMIAALAAARPEWTFLLVGRYEDQYASLLERPNIVRAGPVPYETLPRWAAAFDVCIMPYRAGDFARNANPLKLREYLATGKPVVSTPMPAAAELERFLHVAEGREGLLAALEAGLSQGSSGAAERLAAAGALSWDTRLEETLSVIERRLTETKSQESLS